MANKTIDGFSLLDSVANDDLILIWDTSAGATKKIAFSAFAAADALMKDGSVALTGNWDIGSGRYIAGEKYRARSAVGLRLEDDAGNLGIYIEDNTGNVGIGTATLTGAPRLTVNGAIRASYDTDTTSYLGRAAVGYNGSNSDYASLAHIDRNNSTDYAIVQTAAGITVINSASGQSTRFAIAGVTAYAYDTFAFYGFTDDTYDLGLPGNRWDDIYATNGTIQTSDDRLKADIAPSDLGLSFVRALEPRRYRFVGKPRPHYGLSATQVRAALDELGINDFAGYIHNEEADAYGLRYTEFIAPIIAAIQEVADRLEALEASHAK